MLLPSLLSACALAPAQQLPDERSVSAEQIQNSRLHQSLAPLLAEHPNLSGLYPVDNALDAFSSRMLLVRLAEQSLDVQYYIWRKDNTGTLLLHELYHAAERGVRVRLLLDDLGTSNLDDWLALLDNHPNIEVKLYNPFAIRHLQPLNFITDFMRLNRRMHNKSFTADQSVSLVGGRNIGDEYFAASRGVLFADLDMLAVGPVVEEINQDFERYWYSASAYPLTQIIEREPQKKAQLLSQVQERLARPEAEKYMASLLNTPFMNDLLNQRMQFHWAPARLISDDPAKSIGQSADSDLVMHQLKDTLGKDIYQLDIISPYFVPSKKGTADFIELVQQGAKIRVLTNALEATDVVLVHSGYSKYRKRLLEAGIELYEMQGRPSKEEIHKRGRGMFGSSGSSLHAKTFAVNQQQVFVGSFNFDPRSARLNTEMGLFVEDAELAQGISAVFDSQLQDVAYQVKLDERGRLYWQEQGEPTHIYYREPNSSLIKRSIVKFLSWWPLDWLL